MYIASTRVVASGGALKVSLAWITVSFFLQTCGELSLSPVGLSSMTKLAPERFVGQMMGVWFMASALGNLIAGIVGGHVDPQKINEMPQLFSRTSLSLFIAAAVIWALIIPIRRMMGEAKH
jgi:POT family proton-dependent oligopeptide transporter